MKASYSLDLFQKSFGVFPPLTPGDFVQSIFVHWGGHISGEPQGYTETLTLEVYASEHTPVSAAEVQTIPDRLLKVDIKPQIVVVDSVAGVFAGSVSVRIPLPWPVDLRTRRLSVILSEGVLGSTAKFVTLDYEPAD